MKSFLIAAAAFLAATAAQAQPVHVIPPEAAGNCAAAAGTLKALNRAFGEVPIWIGQADDHTTLIVTQKPDAKTWSLIVVGTDKNGHAIACMIAYGEAPGA